MAATAPERRTYDTSSVSSAVEELDSVFAASGSSALQHRLKRARSSRRHATVSTPALMSLLPPSRKRQRISWLAEAQLEQARLHAQKYKPESRDDLLDRIATFTLTLWNDRKQEGCSAVEFARRGWKCTGKRREEVSCDVCEATWQVAAAEADIATLRSDIVLKHAKNCPWRRKGCSDDLYQLHLSEPPQILRRELLERARTIPPGFDFNIKHPLTEDDVALLESTAQPFTSQSDSSPANQQTIAGLSRNALITALFGWGASSPNTPTSSSTSSASGSSSSLIITCKLCVRRMAVKRAPPQEEAVAGSDTPSSSSSSPSKFTSIDVASSHRRFCPYISPYPGSGPQTGQKGYQALLEHLSHARKTAPETVLAFGATEERPTKTNVRQTREAIQYVKDLLSGGKDTKRIRLT